MRLVLIVDLLALPLAVGIRVGDDERIGNASGVLAEGPSLTVLDKTTSLYPRFARGSLMQETGMHTLTGECDAYMKEIGCSWTEIYTCPGQQPSKKGLTEGAADDDGTIGYHCCCKMQLWVQPKCCACENGVITWSQHGSCNLCTDSDIIEARKPPMLNDPRVASDYCTKPDGSGEFCAHFCVEMFRVDPPKRNAAGAFGGSLQAAALPEVGGLTGWLMRNGWWYWLLDGTVKLFSMVSGVDLPGVMAGLVKSVMQVITGAGALLESRGSPNCAQKLKGVKGGLGLIFVVAVSWMVIGAMFASGGLLSFPVLAGTLVAASSSLKIFKVLKAFTHAVGGVICASQDGNALSLAREIPRTLLRGGFVVILAMALIPGAPDFPEDLDEDAMQDMMKQADLFFTDTWASVKYFKTKIAAMWNQFSAQIHEVMAHGLETMQWMMDRMASVGDMLSISARNFLRLMAKG